MDASIAQLFSATKPRALSSAEMMGLDELDGRRLPPAAAAWLAPFSPSVRASSPTAAAAYVVPPRAVEAFPHSFALDQTVRHAPAEVPDTSRSTGDGGGGWCAAGGDAVGPLLGVASALHLPVSVHDGHVCGLVATDVVVDEARMVADSNPLMRWVYNMDADELIVGASHQGGTIVSAAMAKLVPGSDAIEMVGSILQRPERAGNPPRLLLRTSTLLQGSAPLSRVDRSSPVAAYRSATCRFVGAFGSAVVLAPPPGGEGGGGAAAAAASGDGGAPPSPLVASTLTTEVSSAAVVARLHALVLTRQAVHPGGLRVGRPGRPILPAPPWGTRAVGALLAGAGVGAGGSAGSPAAAAVGAAGAARPPPGTRGRVRLEEIDDPAVRARILRNREAARRSNAKRRAEREAGSARTP